MNDLQFQTFLWGEGVTGRIFGGIAFGAAISVKQMDIKKLCCPIQKMWSKSLGQR